MAKVKGRTSTTYLAIETNALALPSAPEGRGCFFSTAHTKQTLPNSATAILYSRFESGCSAAMIMYYLASLCHAAASSPHPQSKGHQSHGQENTASHPTSRT